VNTERGFKKYCLKEVPGFIWLMTGIAATEEEGDRLRLLVNKVHDTIVTLIKC
jgi:hypothetical protein